jgi:hypothetical protein
LRLAIVRLQELGQAEIGDLGDPLGCEEHVARFQVPMDNRPPRMGVVNRPGQDLNQLGGSAGRLRLGGQFRLQGTALEQLQRQERLALVLADLENLDDVGMLEPGIGKGFGAKAGQPFAAADPE